MTIHFIFKCNNIDYFYNYIQVIANMIHPVGFWKVLINAQIMASIKENK